MGSRIEEEKIERTLRALLKLPGNKRCINCNSLGPQYVCTTFLIFVCTSCSGVHREFTHRVKSVSMAKFTTEEVNSLQAGGNDRARQIYFKAFDPQYHTFPDGSNIVRLREFIKHVYVDRKYTGENDVQKFSKRQLSNEPDERRRIGAYPGGSRSFCDEDRRVAAHSGVSRSFRDQDRKIAVPSSRGRSFSDQEWKIAVPYVGSRSFHDCEDRYERHYSQGASPSVRGGDHNVVKYYYDERKSPRYSQEDIRNGGSRRNPVRFEVVDNRVRDDRKVRSAVTTPKSENRTLEKMLPPMFRENTVPNDQKHAAGSAPNQKMKDGSAVEHKREKLETLIDFNADHEPSDQSDDPIKSKQQQTPPPDNDNNWASFDSSTKEKSPPQVTKPDTKEAPPAPKPDTLEALLLELSPSISVPATASEASSNASEDPSKDDAPSTTSTNNVPAGGASSGAPAEQMVALFDNLGASTSLSTSTSVSVQPSNADPWKIVPTSGGDTSVTVADAQKLPSTQQDQSCINFAQQLPSTQQDQSSISFAQQLPSTQQDQSSISFAQQLPSTQQDQSSISFPQQLPSTQQDQSSIIFAQQLPSTQQDQSSISFAADSGCPSQHAIIIPVEASNNLSRTSSLAPNTEGSLGVSSLKPAQPMMRTQSLPVETRSSTREELPVDLFAAHYPPIPSQASVWQPGPALGMGFNMLYYPNIAPAPAFSAPRSTANPFDINDDRTLAHSTHSPSMSSLEDALHNVSVAPSLMHTSSLGSFTSHLKSQSSHQGSLMPSHSLPSLAAFSSNPHMGEQLQNNAQLLRPQGIDGYSSDDAAAFGTLSSSQQPFQQLSITYPTPSNPETFSSTGGKKSASGPRSSVISNTDTTLYDMQHILRFQ